MPTPETPFLSQPNPFLLPEERERKRVPFMIEMLFLKSLEDEHYHDDMLERAGAKLKEIIGSSNDHGISISITDSAAENSEEPEKIPGEQQHINIQLAAPIDASPDIANQMVHIAMQISTSLGFTVYYTHAHTALESCIPKKFTHPKATHHAGSKNRHMLQHLWGSYQNDIRNLRNVEHVLQNISASVFGDENDPAMKEIADFKRQIFEKRRMAAISNIHQICRRIRVNIAQEHANQAAPFPAPLIMPDFTQEVDPDDSIALPEAIKTAIQVVLDDTPFRELPEALEKILEPYVQLVIDEHKKYLQDRLEKAQQAEAAAEAAEAKLREQIEILQEWHEQLGPNIDELVDSAEAAIEVIEASNGKDGEESPAHAAALGNVLNNLAQVVAVAKAASEQDDGRLQSGELTSLARARVIHSNAAQMAKHLDAAGQDQLADMLRRIAFEHFANGEFYLHQKEPLGVEHDIVFICPVIDANNGNGNAARAFARILCNHLQKAAQKENMQASFSLSAKGATISCSGIRYAQLAQQCATYGQIIEAHAPNLVRVPPATWEDINTADDFKSLLSSF